MLLAFLVLQLLVSAQLGQQQAQVRASQQLQAQQAIIPAYISPYEFENLQPTEDDRFVYLENNQPVSLIGIDVSDHQGEIDWTAVRNNGIGFAFIRVGYRGYTEGAIYGDAQYSNNINGAKAAGIPVGVYFYSSAINEIEAVQEADFVLACLYNTPLEYPVAYDWEPSPPGNGRADALSSEQLTRNAQAFCQRIEQAGYDVMLYGNQRDLRRYSSELLASYDVWYAEYNVSAPTGQLDFTIWQFTSSGVVDGINTRVDLNIQFNAYVE
jgi:GH25 family lysozyme M1 (1,4-beta-N-acetylmuramidase)